MSKKGWGELFQLEKLFLPWKKIQYIIPKQAISDTERVLSEYGSKIPSNEGLVYWAGTKIKNTITVKLVIAPNARSGEQMISTSYRDNFEVIRTLSKYKLVQIGQVHSHPRSWVGHSPGDDEWAPFKVEGLLSIVVPSYCRHGMLPLKKCGVHRYTNEEFVRLTDKCVAKNFIVSTKIDSAFEDLRTR